LLNRLDTKLQNENTKRKYKTKIQNENTKRKYKTKIQNENTKRKYKTKIQNENTKRKYRTKIQNENTKRKYKTKIQSENTERKYRTNELFNLRKNSSYVLNCRNLLLLKYFITSFLFICISFNSLSVNVSILDDMKLVLFCVYIKGVIFK